MKRLTLVGFAVLLLACGASSNDGPARPADAGLPGFEGFFHEEGRLYPDGGMGSSGDEHNLLFRADGTYRERLFGGDYASFAGGTFSLVSENEVALSDPHQTGRRSARLDRATGVLEIEYVDGFRAGTRERWSRGAVCGTVEGRGVARLDPCDNPWPFEWPE